MKSILKIAAFLIVSATAFTSCTTVFDVSQPNDNGQVYITERYWFVVGSSYIVERCEPVGSLKGLVDGKNTAMDCKELDVQFVGGTFN